MIRPSWKKSGNPSGLKKVVSRLTRLPKSLPLRRHSSPNVTGVLHLGHVLNNTIQDILVRRGGRGI